MKYKRKYYLSSYHVCAFRVRPRGIYVAMDSSKTTSLFLAIQHTHT